MGAIDRILKTAAKSSQRLTKTADSIKASLTKSGADADLIKQVDKTLVDTNKAISDGMNKGLKETIEKEMKPKNWFQRHKILTGLGAAGALGGAYAAFGRSSGSDVPPPAAAYDRGAAQAEMDAMQDIQAMQAMAAAQQQKSPYMQAGAPQMMVDAATAQNMGMMQGAGVAQGRVQ